MKKKLSALLALIIGVFGKMCVWRGGGVERGLNKWNQRRFFEIS